MFFIKIISLVSLFYKYKFNLKAFINNLRKSFINIGIPLSISIT